MSESECLTRDLRVSAKVAGGSYPYGLRSNHKTVMVKTQFILSIRPERYIHEVYEPKDVYSLHSDSPRRILNSNSFCFQELFSPFISGKNCAFADLVHHHSSRSPGKRVS